MFFILDFTESQQNATIRIPTIAKWWNFVYWLDEPGSSSLSPSYTNSIKAKTQSLSCPLKIVKALRGRVSWNPTMKMSGSFPLCFWDLRTSAKSIYGVGAFPARFQVNTPIMYSFTLEKECSFFINWFSTSIFAFEVERLCQERMRSIHSYLSSSLLLNVFL